MSLPTVSSYTSPAKPNAIVVTIDGNDFYFSYKTLVAFRGKGRIVVRENEWGSTTGRHLNAIGDGDKKNRVSSEEFTRLYNEEFGEE